MSRWRLSDWILGVLVALVIFSAWVAMLLNADPKSGAYGGDFLQFYTAGQVVNRGETGHLYDQPYFRALQRPLRASGLYSLYPPTMAIVMAPLARLSYPHALAAWWIIQATCFAGAGWIFYRTMPLARPWRINALMALAALLPVWIAIGAGHLAPVLLLVVAGGLALHQRGNPGWAGLLLSALAVKPQFAVAILLWLALRRDRRALLGLAAGLAAQGLAVAALLGPGVCLDYLRAMPAIAAITRAFRYSPIFEQSLPGVVSNVMWMQGYDKAVRVLPMRIAYVLAAGAAALLLCRLLWSRRPWQAGAARTPLAPREAQHHAERDEYENYLPAGVSYEYACVGLFLLLMPPYLLVYDLTLAAVPLVFLWSSPQWRSGILLYATMTVLAAVLYLGIGFSLTGVVALWAMFHVAWNAPPQCQAA
ncbi:MAG: glycosyltransferase family 87 protein [Thermoguttaceae bacterium]